MAPIYHRPPVDTAVATVSCVGRVQVPHGVHGGALPFRRWCPRKLAGPRKLIDAHRWARPPILRRAKFLGMAKAANEVKAPLQSRLAPCAAKVVTLGWALAPFVPAPAILQAVAAVRGVECLVTTCYKTVSTSSPGERNQRRGSIDLFEGSSLRAPREQLAPWRLDLKPVPVRRVLLDLPKPCPFSHVRYAWAALSRLAAVDLFCTAPHSSHWSSAPKRDNPGASAFEVYTVPSVMGDPRLTLNAVLARGLASRAVVVKPLVYDDGAFMRESIEELASCYLSRVHSTMPAGRRPASLSVFLLAYSFGCIIAHQMSLQDQLSERPIIDGVVHLDMAVAHPRPFEDTLSAEALASVALRDGPDDHLRDFFERPPYERGLRTIARRLGVALGRQPDSFGEVLFNVQHLLDMGFGYKATGISHTPALLVNAGDESGFHDAPQRSPKFLLSMSVVQVGGEHHTCIYNPHIGDAMFAFMQSRGLPPKCMQRYSSRFAATNREALFAARAFQRVRSPPTSFSLPSQRRHVHGTFLLSPFGRHGRSVA